jgi:hypothetical protein
MKEIANNNYGIDPDTWAVLKEAFEFNGKLKAVNQLHEYLGSTMMRALMLIEEKKIWRLLGYSGFAAFLDSDEVPEFGKTKFYKLKERFINEGDQRFDLLTRHKIPVSTRLALAENGVEIELDGNDIVIGGNRVPANDKQAVKELFDALKNSFVLRDHREKELEKSKDKLKKEVEKQERTIASLQNANSVGLVNTAYMEAVIDLNTAYKHITEETEKLSPEDKQKWRDIVFEGIADSTNKLSKAFGLRGYGLDLAVPPPEPTGNELDDYIAKGVHQAARDATLPEGEADRQKILDEDLRVFLDNVDLDANDADLATQL